MKNLTGKLLFIGGLVLLAVIPCLAQQQYTTISDLKNQISRLETIDRDRSTPAEAWSMNHKFLEEQRALLHTLLVKRINALKAYKQAAGSALLIDEARVLDLSIHDLEAELQNLERDMRSDAESSVNARVTNTAAATAQSPPASVVQSNSLPTLQSAIQVSASASNTLRAMPNTTPPGVEIIDPAKPFPANLTAVGKIALKLAIYDDTAHPDNNLKKLLVRVDNGVQVRNDNLDISPDRSNRQVITVPLFAGKNTIKLFAAPKASQLDASSLQDQIDVICTGSECGGEATSSTTGGTASTAKTSTPPLPDAFSSIYSRAGIGFEQAGASSAESSQRYMLEFFWNPPLKTARGRRCVRYNEDRTCAQYNSPTNPYDDVVGPPVSGWVSVKFASVPQQVASPLTDVATSFLTPIAAVKANDLIQGFDFLGGFEFALPRGSGVFLGKRTRLSFIVGGGAINPLSPKQSAQIFDLNDVARAQLIALYPNVPGLAVATNTHVAFVQPDVDRFQRQFYGGLRLKVHHYDDEYGLIPSNRPPSMIDVMIGQSEAITGGRLHGMVLRIDGFYPFPLSSAKFVYLYGTANLKLNRRPTFTEPIIMAPAPALNLFSPNLVTLTSPPSNRDFYRIGIGLSVFDLINCIRNAGCKQEQKAQGASEQRTTGTESR